MIVLVAVGIIGPIIRQQIGAFWFEKSEMRQQSAITSLCP